MALVTGEIVVADGEEFSGGVLYVRLEDVSMPGAPATIISEQVIRGVDAAAGRIKFSLDGSLPADNDASSRYNVRAHISLHGGNEFQRGDFLSTQSYPVLTHGNPKHVTVQVKRI